MKNCSSRTLGLLLVVLLPVAAAAGGNKARAITNWLVMFNDPSACGTAPCTDADLFLANNAAKVTICYVTGQVVQANGRATFAGRFAEGTNYGCFYPGMPVPYGLMDAEATEIHIVAQEHGAALKSGAGLEDQVLYFQGACNPDCEDTQFAVHWSGSGPTVGVFRFADGSQVRKGTSLLVRDDDGIRMTFHTRFDRVDNDDDSDSDSD